MDLNGIGYSNIRLPNDNRSYIYTYNSYVNIFPEEVFMHEFLHTLERILIERDFDIPLLHDYAKYGYQDKQLIGQKEWYRDYMTKNIETENGYIGLDEIVYSMTPPAESDFEYSEIIDFNKEPSNIFEELVQIFKNIVQINWRNNESNRI